MHTLRNTLFALAVIILCVAEGRADPVVITGGTITFDTQRTVGELSLTSNNFNIAAHRVDAGLREPFGYLIGDTVNLAGGAGAGFPILTSGTINGVRYDRLFVVTSISFFGSGVLQPDGTLTAPIGLRLNAVFASQESRAGELLQPLLLSTQTGVFATGTLHLTFRLNSVGGYDAHLGTITINDAKPVPEPVSLVLLGTGLAGVGAAVRRRRKSHKT